MTNHSPPFHGSYLPDDVTFLLNKIEIDSTEVLEKEKLIQSGQKHYSEMLTKETIPSRQYLALFEAACDLNIERMAHDCLLLAFVLQKQYPNGITLVSLARAGTPVGVILNSIIKTIFQSACTHYSVSIIRDKGIDCAALHAILKKHPDTSIAFIDGWTGKGVISTELTKNILEFNIRNNTSIDSGLYVIADLAGSAKWAATTQDYLIPSSILNATVSGLISRSILYSHPPSSQFIPKIDTEETAFHGCYYYKEFIECDLSLKFKDRVVNAALKQFKQIHTPQDFIGYFKNFQIPEFKPNIIQKISREFMQNELKRQNLSDENLIKPSIGEATRVLLRRNAHLVLVRNKTAQNVQHILQLALEKQVPVEERPSLPYEAVSIIKVKS